VAAPERKRRRRSRKPKYATSVDAHVGRRLRLLRERQNLLLKELGNECDLSYQQIQKYERGTHRISASRLYQLAQILGVSVGAFFVGLSDQAKNNSKWLMVFASSREGRELLESFDRIRDPRVRREVLQTIRQKGLGRN
jgi:transcriptional regulator with XRE-family HTH domain